MEAAIDSLFRTCPKHPPRRLSLRVDSRGQRLRMVLDHYFARCGPWNDNRLPFLQNRR